MAREIKYTPKTDIPSTIIQDTFPEKVLRLYPYSIVNENKGRTVFQNAALTVLSISQIPYTIDSNPAFGQLNLKQDENGEYYFEVLGILTDTGLVDTTQTLESHGPEFQYEKNLIAFSTDIISKEKQIPFICTIGRPLNKDDYRANKQGVFFMDVINSTDNWTEGKTFMDANNLTGNAQSMVSLVNVNTILSAYPSAKLEFNTNVKVQADGSIVDASWAPLVDDGQGNLIPGFEIDVEKTALINYIDVEALGGDGVTTADITSTGNLMPIKGTPIDVSDKTTILSDWFDYDVVMPLYVAKLFIGGESMDILKSQDIVSGSGTFKAFTQEEVDLINDMILVSYGFATQWAEFPRYVASDNEVKNNLAKEGDIRGDVTIGSGKLKVIGLVGQDPMSIVDGIFETYIRENPQDENSAQRRILKQIMAAVSRFIYSSYGIGRGQNSFNQIYLPWYLAPLTSSSIGFNYNSSAKLISIKPVTWVLQSRWFDMTQGDANSIKPKAEVDLSEIKMIQTDRKLTIPKVPSVLNALTKLPLPGDISTNTSSELQYMWYMPFEGVDFFRHTFLNEPEVKVYDPATDSGDRYFNTAWTAYGTAMNRSKAVSDAVRALYGLSMSAVDVITDINSDNNLETTTERRTIDNPNYNHARIEYKARAFSHNTGDTAFAAWMHYMTNGRGNLQGWNAPNFNDKTFAEYYNDNNQAAEWDYDYYDDSRPSTTLRLSPRQQEVVIAHLTGLDVDTITWQSGTMEFVNHYGYQSDIDWYIDLKMTGVTFLVERQRLGNVHIKLKQPPKTVEYNIDRRTIFDKSGWTRLIRQMDAQTGTPSQHHTTLKLIDEFGEEIQRIDSITIGSLFTNEFVIRINGEEFDLTSVNQFDEAVVLQKIIFA